MLYNNTQINWNNLGNIEINYVILLCNRRMAESRSHNHFKFLCNKERTTTKIHAIWKMKRYKYINPYVFMNIVNAHLFDLLRKRLFALRLEITDHYRKFPFSLPISSAETTNSAKIIMTDPAFIGAGKQAGLELWRVESMEMKKIPEVNGKFYEGDSYILLSTTENKGFVACTCL